MSFLLWTGLFLLSFTWLFNLNLYTSERDAWWIIPLVLGTLFNSAALKGKTSFISLDKKHVFLLIPLVLSLFHKPGRTEKTRLLFRKIPLILWYPEQLAQYHTS